MKKLLYILTISLIFCYGCDNNGGAIDDNGQLVEFTSTKGVGDGKAYRIYLNGIDGTDSEGVEATGTYCDKTDGEQFVPCEVDTDGKYVKDDDTKGLRAINGPYKMHMVYPAIAMTPIPYAGYTNLNGYFYQRNGEGVAISQTSDVTLRGVYLSKDNGDEYIFDGSDMLLQQPRSRIKINFACGTAIQATTLQKLSFKNIISEGYYRPAESRFYYSDANISDKVLFDASAAGGAELTLSTGQSQELSIDEYILSMDYAEKDAQGNTKWPLPSFVIEIGETQAEVVSFTAAIGWLFKPQRTYLFTFTINSMYVNVTVEALPWEDGGDNSGEVNNPEIWSIDFPLKDGSENNLLEWEEIDGIHGEIQ